MTRATLTLELLAVLACACERQDDAARAAAEAGIPVESADPEWDNEHLEQELDRIEKEIVAGKNSGDAGALPRSKSGVRLKVDPDAEKAAPQGRNKSKNFRNKRSEGRSQRSGSGSS